MSFPGYPEYKDSGVDWLGSLPLHWRTKRLKFIFKIKKRIAGVLGHDVLSVTQRGVVVKDLDGNRGQFSDDYAKYQFVEFGDFIMNGMDLLTGYVDISKYQGVTSPDYRVFGVISLGEWNERFLLYLLQNGYKRKVFYAYGQGSSLFGRWRFPTQQFKDFIFPEPPLEEQCAIVRLLDRETAKIDALVGEQEELIAILKEKRQAVISCAVTKGLDPDVPMKESGLSWLGEVPEHWRATKLRLLTKQIVDGAHLTPTYVDDGVPFLRVTDITAPTVDIEAAKKIPESEHDILSRRCNPAPGDLLLSKNGTVGVPRVVTWEWPFSIFVSLCLIKFTPDYNAHYAEYVFLSSEIAAQINDGSKQSTVTNLHLEKISGFRVPVPPLEEQVEIVAYLDENLKELDELIAESEIVVDLLKERRSALISAAVTGKIDVRGLVPAETTEAA